MSSTSNHFLVFVRSGNHTKPLWAYDNRKAAEEHRDFILGHGILEPDADGILRQFVQNCFVRESSMVVRSKFNPNEEVES